ncbi:serine acetyltransferase [uncultured Butyricimonas sp.]|uniref:PglD-related sugar-binding protein n=1 Tax=uncultured Butyricimonas sp. TaxID=1268785 RepID=UPI0026DB0CB1|nr:serine acetyltransferase [uncultured Butyricimonas sp.]
MKDIAIYGASGFGREVACLIRQINEVTPIWNLVGFFDDNVALKGKEISHYGSCLGGITELNNWDKTLSVVIAVGNPKVIAMLVEKIENSHVNFPNIIHPNFKIIDPETFYVGKGNIIQSNCLVSCNVTFGDFNVFNGSVVFGHDNKVGNYNCFMPAVRVSGGVVVGDSNFFGVGSIILQQIKIGNHIRLGAGSVLMTKPKDGKLYMGNPAKKMEL